MTLERIEPSNDDEERFLPRRFKSSYPNSDTIELLHDSYRDGPLFDIRIIRNDKEVLCDFMLSPVEAAELATNIMEMLTERRSGVVKI